MRQQTASGSPTDSRASGELRVPFTTGILIGIGESRRDRIESLLAISELDAQHGHVQEVIIQNFRAKPLTAMRGTPEPRLKNSCGRSQPPD
ncbi:MAG: hypothetical protein CM1200mP22_28390 [Dehalococcoidia bacterium]|nr:MAG: hypothetical protein CM1200mP22_28390 [Dehalococcoidia bacterium]